MADSTADRTLEPPTRQMTSEEQFRWLYDIWQRTGGFENAIVNLVGLVASVEELNTLVGILTTTTVQAQLNSKANLVDLGTIASQNADDVDITGGILENVDISTSNVAGHLSQEVGTSGDFKLVPAALNSNITEVANTDNLEDTLMSFTLEPDSLGTNGDYIDITAWGSFAANANNKRIRLYFGATVIYDSTALALNAGAWRVNAIVARRDLADQTAIASVISSNTLLPALATQTNPSESLDGNVLIKLTGLGIAANDIIQQGMVIKWFPAV